MTENRNRRKLKNILINPRYQLKYVMLASFAGVILTIANATLFYRFVSENYAILVQLSPMTDEAKDLLYKELRTIVGFLTISSLAFVAVVAWLALMISHRTAGPLFHFNRVFNEIRSGKRDVRIHLRPEDDFQEVAESFNRMMDTIHDGGNGKG